MAYSTSSNQNQFSLPLHCSEFPALFNANEGSLSFLPRPPLGNESNMIQDLNSSNHRTFLNDCRMIQYSCPVPRPLLEREPRIILNHPSTNQISINRSNMARNSNLLQYQLSPNVDKGIPSFYPLTSQPSVNRPISIQESNLLRHQQLLNGTQMAQDFHPVTGQLARSNIPEQSHLLLHQLHPNRICVNKNSNNSIHQPYRSISNVAEVEHSTTHVMSQKETRISLNYQPEKEFTMRQGLQSIFQPQSQDGLGMLQNSSISGQQMIKSESVGSKGLYPSSNNFTKMVFNMNEDLPSVHNNLPISDVSLQQNLYPQYSENVHICVIGPPGCGKADLIRTFVRSDKIRISVDKPFSWVVQHGMASFGTTLNIDIWYVEDIIPAVEDLRSHCEFSKSVILLVYSIARRSTLKTVKAWIKLLKRDRNFNVPIMLVGNNSNVEFYDQNQNLVSCMDGFRVREKYGLAEFYKCSTEIVNDVEALFLFAAHKAFHRTIQR